MIHLILGRQGSGKTLFAVKQAYEAYLRGRTVYSNVALKFPYKKIDYEDIINCRLENAVVIIDEIHLLLPARNSMSKRSRLICDNFLSMVRKKGLDIYGTTQTERKVDVRFRDEKDYLYICGKYGFINRKWVEIKHSMNLDINIPILIYMDVLDTFSDSGIKLSFIANSLFKLYNTKEIVKIIGVDDDPAGRYFR